MTPARRKLSAPLVSALLVLAACSRGEVQETGQPERLVYTTFYPTTFLAERIAGDALRVVCPLPEGADPIFWQPSREVLAEYQEADLIVVNGAEFEKWLASASLPESRVVDTTAAMAGNFLTFETSTHSHGPTGEHTHEGIDGHTWVDPLNAKLQARAIWQALVQRWPEHAAPFETNRRALDDELDLLHERVRSILPRLEEATLLASHPAYDYLAHRHGLELENFDFDPESELGEADFARVAEALEGRSGAGVILWESAPLPASVEALRARLGVESVLFSPCEGPPERGDYLTEMHANLDRLEAALAR